MKPPAKGAAGEEYAAAYLKQSGYQILKRNFRIRSGEVDIIAVRQDVVAFVEVKTWDHFGLEDVGISIDERKRDRIRRAARVFLIQSPRLRNHRVRFDVVLVSGQISKIDHIEGAFDGT